MKIAQIIQSINTQLSGEILSIAELRDFIDKAIDDINIRLNTNFPVLSTVLEQSVNTQIPEYMAIPDKYIRTVVIPGAVFKYYTTDEEGAAVAPKYEEEYLKGLFYMERDYLSQIPTEYLADDRQGYMLLDALSEEGEFTIDGTIFQL